MDDDCGIVESNLVVIESGFDDFIDTSQSQFTLLSQLRTLIHSSDFIYCFLNLPTFRLVPTTRLGVFTTVRTWTSRLPLIL